MIERDLEELHITYEDVITNTITKQKLKTLATNAAFGKLKEKLESLKKVRHLIYKSLEIQPYLLSDILSQDDRKTLTALRSQCVKGIRHNFSKMYKMSLKCPLLCNDESPQEDTQDHILKCTKLSKGTQMNINKIYDDDLQVQANVVKAISMLLKTRHRLIEEQEDLNHSLPGALFLDQTLQQQLGVSITQSYIV